MTSVLMVSGSWPPDACGVGDYTDMLSRELETNGIEVVRFASQKFSRLLSREIIEQVDQTDCDLIHIQYPTMGYGRSFTPSALAGRIKAKPVLVTIHEYAVFRRYRQAWFTPFAQGCAARVFTNTTERGLFEKRFPSRNGIDAIIEIGSNIPVCKPLARSPRRVVHFGLIAPNKGLEAFLSLCERGREGLEFEMIGAVPPRHRRYADAVLQRARACGVHLSLNLTKQAVAERLASATYAYLPFPDGASAKRGTLAAAVVNGLVVVTPHDDNTPEWIRFITRGADTPELAGRSISDLHENGAALAEIRKRIDSAATRFRWDSIAQRHIDLYWQVLAMTTRRSRHFGSAELTTAKYQEARMAL